MRVLLIVLLFVSICIASSSAEEPATEPDQLLSYDFGQDIDTQVLIDVRGASERINSLIGARAMGAESHHPRDESILGVKWVGLKHQWTTNGTVSLIGRYLSEHGTLPNNAVELFPELLTDQGREAFGKMYFTERMLKYGPGVNFATARFHDGFQDPAWRPGGIYVELLKQDEAGNFLHDGRTMSFDLYDPTGSIAVYYKVFSAAEGEVLYDDYTVFPGAAADR